jgi:hypothetical protein
VKRSTFGIIAAIAVTVIVAGQIVAQQPAAPFANRAPRPAQEAPPPAMSIPAMPVSYVLGIESVMEQLSLSAQQREGIRSVQSQFVQEQQRDYAALESLPPEQQQAKAMELEQKAQKRGQAMQQQVEGLLSPQQMQQARQIAFRMGLPGAVSMPEVAQQIQLSETQQQKIEQIRQATQQKILDAQLQMGDQFFKVLSPEQQARLQQMMAPPPVRKPAPRPAAPPAK